MTPARSICFVSLQLGDLFAGNRSVKTGGAETQTYFLIKNISQRMICKCIAYPFDTKRMPSVDCEFLFTDSRLSQYSGFKKMMCLIKNLWNLLALSGSEIFYFRCGGWVLGVVTLYARLHGKKVIFHGAHEHDFYKTKQMTHLKTWERFIYTLALGRVTRVICQTQSQAHLIEENYPNLKYEVIPNFWPNFWPKEKEGIIKQRKCITYISNFRAFKRPEWVVWIAKKNPGLQFKMIGAPYGDTSMQSRLLQSADKILNLEMLGSLAPEKTEEVLDETLVLINTSSSEGFPNTYLQAFRKGLPVLTTFDPGLDIEKRQLGKVVSTLEAFDMQLKWMISHIHEFDPKTIKDIFEKYYSEEAVIPYFKALFEKEWVV